MDLLRSCYTGLVKFRNSDSPVSVKWFFCGPQAEVFSGPTIFRSQNYEDQDIQNNGLGEQRPSKRPWANGKRVAGFVGNVPLGCNPPDWWVDGIPDSVSYSIPRDKEGVPLCCAARAGGLLFNGNARWVAFGNHQRIGGLVFGGSADARGYPVPSLYLKTILTNPTPGSTYNDTFTSQTWTTRIEVTVVGPGGGGGGAAGSSITTGAGGGGSSGGTFNQEWPLMVQPR
jgi:hypothetical protein